MRTAAAGASPVSVQLGLQQQAPSNLRRHVAREALRVGTVFAADLVSFVTMRAFVQAVRDDRVLGAGIAHLLQVVLARGILNGWQFGVSEAACREVMAHEAVGFVDVDSPPSPRALGHIAQFPALLHAAAADTVVVCGHPGDARLRGLVAATLAAGCRLLIAPGTLEATGASPAIVWQDGQALIELTTPALKGRQLLVKGAGDLIGGLGGLVLASPLMLLLAAAIKLDSSGPAIFGQERIGSGGRRFRVLKVRAVRHGASDAAHPGLIRRLQAGDGAALSPAAVFKLVDDDRVTRVGRWLRRSSLD